MLAIIGGTGLYNLGQLEITNEQMIDTPFGKPSAPLVFGKYCKQQVVFLPRHGKNHELLPHEINYRANIWALKFVGALRIISISAVGSLQQEIHPGDFVIASQYFDWIKDKRDKTFFGNGLVAHVSTAIPVCPSLTQLIVAVAQQLKIKTHTEKIYAGVDGPRFGTKAESNFLKNVVQCDVLGMTNIPEIFLAREAQICYCSIGIVTDYDCWYEDPAKSVTTVAAIEQYKKSLNKVKVLLNTLLMAPFPAIDSNYRESLKYAVLSPTANLSVQNKQLLELLQR